MSEYRSVMQWYTVNCRSDFISTELAMQSQCKSKGGIVKERKSLQMPDRKDKSVNTSISYSRLLIYTRVHIHTHTHEKEIKGKLGPVQLTPRSLNDIKDAHEKRYGDLRRRKRKDKRICNESLNRDWHWFFSPQQRDSLRRLTLSLQWWE